MDYVNVTLMAAQASARRPGTVLFKTGDGMGSQPQTPKRLFGRPRVRLNYGHAQNPQRTRFLRGSIPGGSEAVPAVGIDGQSGPMGSPYLITLDLNDDHRARGIMYRQPAVSQDLQGFVKEPDARNNLVFEVPASILVWSAGADRRVDPQARATQGVNRDNLLSCGG